MLSLVKKHSLHIMKFGTDGTTTSAKVITYRATVSDFGPSSKGGPAKNLYTRFVLMWEEKVKQKEACSVSHLQRNLGWV